MRTLFTVFIIILFTMFLAASLTAQWVQTSLDSVSVTCFAIKGANLYAGTNIGIFLSTDNGSNWSDLNYSLPNSNVWSLAASPTGYGSEINFFAGTNGGGVYFSTNNGISWNEVNSGLKNLYISDLAILGDDIFAGTNGGGIYYSTDNGTKWNHISTGLNDIFVLSLAVSDTNLFAGTNGDGVFLIAKYDTTWYAVNAGLDNKYVKSLVVSGTNLFAGTYWDGVFLSTNNGTNWTAVNNGLAISRVHAFAVTPNESGYGTNIFAATRSGVFLSTNNGTQWNAVNTGLNDTAVYALAVIGTNLFAGTYLGGVWRRPLSEIISSVPMYFGIPEEFSLGQNYPNPFNPSTTISYRLPTQSQVMLKVYDVLGREVAKLVNSVEQPGYKSVNFDASRLSSGLYYYRLQAGAYTETKKLLLLR